MDLLSYGLGVCIQLFATLGQDHSSYCTTLLEVHTTTGSQILSVRGLGGWGVVVFILISSADT